MRLSCPNCDARYEVPDEVIPASGRDVQCSNCGQTWFQHHPDNLPDEDELDTVTLDEDIPDPDEETAPPPPPEPARPAAPARRELDPGVADILRQEAEAEFEARKRRQAQPLESQPDLGLEETEEPAAPPPPPRPATSHDDAERRAQDARRRMARMRGEPDPMGEAAATAAAISSRRELLPDIEEINSTLRNDNGPSGVDGDAREELGAGGEVKRRKRGYRGGLLLMLAVFALLTLAYVYAPRIALALPAVDPLLNSYVTWVDHMRIALDTQVSALLHWLDEVATSQSGS